MSSGSLRAEKRTFATSFIAFVALLTSIAFWLLIIALFPILLRKLRLSGPQLPIWRPKPSFIDVLWLNFPIFSPKSSLRGWFWPCFRPISSFQVDLACARINWSTRTRFARVNNIASWLSFLASPLYLALTKPNWHFTIRNGCSTFARILAFRYS